MFSLSFCLAVCFLSLTCPPVAPAPFSILLAVWHFCHLTLNYFHAFLQMFAATAGATHTHTATTACSTYG